MPDLADGEVAHVQGSAKEPYELKNVGGVYSCSCPAWRNAGGPIDRRTCKHLKTYRGVEAEATRLGSSASSLALPAPKKPKPQKANDADGQNGSAAGDDNGEGEGGEAPPPVLLAHKWETDVDLTGWWMSEKLDGVRAWWDGEKFRSRLGNTFFAPAWFTEKLPKVSLDGELFSGRKEFNQTVSIVRRQDAGNEWKKIKFLIFDAPHLDVPFEDRVSWIKGFVEDCGCDHLLAVEQQLCVDTEHIKAELARVEALGGEGLMMRRPGSKYEAGRSTSLLKVKTFHDAEGRVVGHEPGKGKHKGRLGALVMEMPDGTRFNVGTGFSDVERGDPPPIGAIVTYRYQELTKDGVPRFPSYVGLAIDKAGPTAVTSAPVPAPPPPAPPKTTPSSSSSSSSSSSNGHGSVVSEAKKHNGSSVIEGSKSGSGPSPATATSNGHDGAPAARRYVAVEHGSEKYWEIVVDGAATTVRFGKLGSVGQERTRTFASEAAARDDAEKLVKEKTGKGYRPA